MAADDEERRENDERRNTEERADNADERSDERRGNEGEAPSGGSRSFIPLILSGSCLFALLCTLLFTEFIFDASVWLEKKILLGLIVTMLVMSAFFFIPSKTIALVLSALSTVIFIALLIWLVYRRNRVTKYYISATQLSKRDTRRIGEKMQKSQILIIGTSKRVDLPHDIVEFNRVSCREKLKLNARINKKDEGRCDNLLSMNPETLRKARFSGIKRNLVIMVHGPDMNDQTYTGYGFKAF